MALFKINKGSSTNLSSVKAHEGWAYFTTDDGKLYIDIAGSPNGSGEYVTEAELGSNRILLNAGHADTATELVPAQSKTFTGVIGTAANWANSTFFFGKVLPTSYDDLWTITYKVTAIAAGDVRAKAISVFTLNGYNDTYASYAAWNTIKNTSYRPCYYHVYYRAKSAGISNGYGHLMGLRLYSSWNYTTAANARTITIEIIETKNCSFTFFDNMTKYADAPGSGNTNYNTYTEFDFANNGLQEVGDNNTIDDPQVYFNAKTGPIGIWGYSLFMEDGSGTYQNICTASDGTLTSSNRTTATTKIANTNGFKPGSKVYYTNTTYGANSSISGYSAVYNDVSLFDSRYAFNTSLTAGSLTAYKPVYLVGTIGADGLFYLDATWWTQTPNETNKVYVLVGGCYDSTTSNCRMSLYQHNPWYYYDGTALQPLYAIKNHTHGNITNDGKIGTTTDLAVVTTTNGEITTANLTTSNPDASGSGTAFVATVSQNSKGKLTITRKYVQDGTTSQKGIVQIGSTASTVAAGNHDHNSTYLKLDGSNNMSGDINIITGDNDKAVNFWYDTNKKAGASWRIAMLGTGSSDTNYFVIQSGSSTTTATTWNNTIRIGQNTFDVQVSGNLYPSITNTKTLGTSNFKWSNVYATTFTGNLTGNVTGNVSGSSGSCTGNAANVTGVVAIANGGTGQTSADEVFSALSWTAGTTAGPTLSATVVGKNRTATIPSASASASGIVTTNDQTISGKKTFKYTTRIYPRLGASQEHSQWYKITFPYYNAETTSSAKWFMNSFDLHFGGGYSDNAAGMAHVTFYWSRAKKNGAWSATQVSAQMFGIYANKVALYYRTAEPGILYVNNSSNVYNGVWLDNLYVDDTSPTLDWSTTKIEVCAAITDSTSPALSAYTQVQTARLYTENGSVLKTNVNFEGQYIKGTWLYTSAATSISAPTKIAVIHTDNFVYYVTPQNLRNTMGLGNTLDAVPIANGGTGATTAAAAWTALGGGASGKHADNYFALAGHNHDSTYLKLTGGTLTGDIYFNSNAGARKFYICRGAYTGESTGMWQDDSYFHVDITNDEITANIQFKLYATDTENSDGSNAQTSYINFEGNGGKSTIKANYFSGDGSSLTNLNGSNISSGTVAAARIDSAIARLASPALTGTPTAPTAADGTNTTQIATTAFVMSQFKYNDAMIYKGVVNANGNLPATHYQGWTYKVGTAGTYAGIVCEVGDMIICNTDGTSANNAHWNVIQTNIDGAVIGPSSSTDGNIVLFDGTTGKIIKNSTYSPSSFAAASHGTHVTTATVQSALSINTSSGSASKCLTEKGTFVAFNNYSHPTGDGNLHVPATGTSNNGKFLKAGSTAGSASWSDLPAASDSVAGITKVGASGGAAAYSHGTHVTTSTVQSALSINTSSGSTSKCLTEKGTFVAFNNYSLPLAANGTRGGIQIGYSESGTNYAVKLSSEKAYVSVPWTDTKVTSSSNHYSPTTASGSDKTASASGATAAWSIDVVKGITINTDGKGHITGLSVTSGKIPANPNTDTKVKQSASTTADWRKVLLHYKNDATSTTAVTDSTEQVYGCVGISAQASTGTLRASKYNVNDKVTLQWNDTDQSLDFVFA